MLYHEYGRPQIPYIYTVDTVHQCCSNLLQMIQIYYLMIRKVGFLGRVGRMPNSSLNLFERAQRGMNKCQDQDWDLMPYYLVKEKEEDKKEEYNNN